MVRNSATTSIFRDELCQLRRIKGFGFEPTQDAGFNVDPLDQATVLASAFVAGCGTALFELVHEGVRAPAAAALQHP